MGGGVSKKKPKVKLVLIGPSESGKTTLLYRWRLGETVKPVPTIGFNYEDLTEKATDTPAKQICERASKVSVFDLAGQEKLRHLWAHYTRDMSCLVWVMNPLDQSNAEANFSEFIRFNRLRGKVDSEHGFDDGTVTAIVLNVFSTSLSLGAHVSSALVDIDEKQIAQRLELPMVKPSLSDLSDIPELTDQCGNEAGIVQIIWEMLPGLDKSDPRCYPWRIFRMSVADLADADSIYTLLRWCVEATNDPSSVPTGLDPDSTNSPSASLLVY